ncbi:winged helix-turn-helix transcriptional regulator [Vallitalea okinawensis]|uniref:winged helix-turn-helix transcriptional regulator n=1 Tax=Vallitalea okinawensis TaxID=2078660 RepID=UPI000CFAB854|nr:helix-turn-helix domain-containing protein [Vallitalea okinawensis]
MKDKIEVNEKGKLDCSIERTMSIIGGKWKPVILWHLGTDGTLRYNQLRKMLPGIAHKMLSQQLRELEKDNLIIRKQYNEVPPKVEYSLTERGQTVMPILQLMHTWGKDIK